MDDMLKNQLKALYDGLPENFAAAAFLFMLQRASEIGRRMDRFPVPALSIPYPRIPPLKH